MRRPYQDYEITELENIMAESKHRRATLAELKNELEHRTTDRAQRLLREIKGLLEGEVPTPPRSRRRGLPGEQLDLDDLE